jgi:DNA replication protein DnaC
MSYGQDYADLLFQVISQRYQRRSIAVYTNRVFAEWAEVFPNAPSIIALVDRLCHNAEIVSIDADSYRNKETLERNTARKAARRPPRKP